MTDNYMKDMSLEELCSQYDRGILDTLVSTSYIQGWIDSEHELIENNKDYRGIPTAIEMLDRLYRFVEEINTETFIEELRRRLREVTESK